LELSAASAISNSLTFSATGLPDGLVVDLNTAPFPARCQRRRLIVPVHVHFTVSDGTNSTSQDFAWKVAPITVNAITDQFNFDGTKYSLAVTAHYHGRALSSSAPRDYPMACRSTARPA